MEYYLLENIEFGGEKTSQLALIFMDTAGAVGLVGRFTLTIQKIRIWEKVKKEMKRIYGDSIPEVYEYGRSSISPEQIQEDVIKESETVKVWGGPNCLRFWKKKPSGQNRELRFPSPMEMQEETWERFRENARLVTGEWVNLLEREAKRFILTVTIWRCIRKWQMGKGSNLRSRIHLPTFPQERIML